MISANKKIDKSAILHIPLSQYAYATTEIALPSAYDQKRMTYQNVFCI